MKSTRFVPLFLLALAMPIAAQDSGGIGFFARGSVGYDVIGGNLAFGGGAGYSFPLLGAWTEVMADVFAGFYSTSSTEGSWTYNETGGLAIVAVHYDYMVGYDPGKSGLYGLVGAGLFAGSWWWDSDDVYNPDRSHSTSSDSGSSFGTILDLGIGFALSRSLDVRVEVPVLVYFEGGITIPIVATAVYRF